MRRVDDVVCIFVEEEGKSGVCRDLIGKGFVGISRASEEVMWVGKGKRKGVVVEILRLGIILVVWLLVCLLFFRG